MDHMDEFIMHMKQQMEQQEKQDPMEDLSRMIAQIQSNIVTEHDLDLKMEEQVFFENHLTIYLPSSYVPMDEKTKKMKYPHENRPAIIYTDLSNTVNIGINHIKENLPEELIPDFRKIMQQSYQTVNPSAKICDTGDLELNGRVFSYYSFNNFAIGGQMYNLIFVAPLNGEVLVVNLNCLKKDQDRYQQFFYAIMHTVKLSHT